MKRVYQKEQPLVTMQLNSSSGLLSTMGIQKGSNKSYQQLFRTDPVVLGELDIKLDIKISLVKGVSVLRHALSSHHPD